MSRRDESLNPPGGSGRGSPLILGVLLLLSCDGSEAGTPPATVTLPPVQQPEIRFEERKLHRVAEEADFSGGIVSPDGKLLAYRTYVKGSYGSQYRAVIGDQVSRVGGGFAFHLSPDGRTIAAVAHRGSWEDGRGFVIVGSHTSDDFLQVEQFMFSGDGKTFAYRALDQGGRFVVVGDKKIGPYDMVDRLSLSHDGSVVAFEAFSQRKKFVVAGGRQLGMEYDDVGSPVVSPDGKKVAYVATRRYPATRFRDAHQKQFVVVDGKAGEEFGQIPELRWSPDGQTVVYLAADIGSDRRKPAHGAVLVQGTKRQAGFDGARQLSFGPDGKTLFLQAYRAGKWFLVAGGRQGPEFDEILDPRPHFSRDGKTFAYRARRQGKQFMVVGEKAGPPCDQVLEPSFGADGNTLVYAARNEGKMSIVVGGEVRKDAFTEDFTSVGKIVLSPDGKLAAYYASTPNGGFQIVGGRKFNLRALSDFVFSPDGTQVGVLELRGRDVWWKVLSGPFDADPPDLAAPPVAREESLVGYWKFDEVDGAKAYDSSGRSNHGSFINEPEASKDVPPGNPANPGSRAFQRERSQRVEVPDAPTLNFRDGSLTLAAWVRFPEAIDADQGILEKCYRERNMTLGGYRLQVSREGHLIFSVVPVKGGPRICASTAGKVLPGTWTHVAGVYDFDTRRSGIYVNGERVGSEGGVPAPFDCDKPLWIGSDYTTPLGARLDEVRIYKRALSEAELRTLATGAGRAPVVVIQDDAILQRMVNLHLAGDLQEPGKVSLPELERAGLKLAASGQLSLDGIALAGEVFQRSRDSSVRGKILEPLLWALDAPEAPRRIAAAKALGYAGPSPLDKVAVLGDALKRTQDKRARGAFVGALGHLGPKGVPALLAVLSGAHTPPSEHGNLFDCPDLLAFSSSLERSDVRGVDAKAVPALLQEALASEDRAVRAAVAYVLAKQAGSYPENFTALAPALLAALKDPDALVRQRTAKTFGETLVGAPHPREAYRPALPALLEALSDPHPAVRYGAADSLGHLADLAPAEISRALTQALRDPDKNVRVIASIRLKYIAPPVPLLDAELDRATQVGGSGGGPFRETGPREGHLVGFRGTTALFNDREFIKSLVPVYRLRDTLDQGLAHGRPAQDRFETIARHGYAVGGVVAQGGDRVHGFHAVFMKITPGGLDPNDKYAGYWIGSRGTDPFHYLGESGTRVVGICGREGADLDALGLVFDPTATLESAPVPVDAEGFIQRWLVLGPIPLGDLAADPTAALGKQWIPNLAGVTPTQHEKVVVEDVEWQWRVENSAGFFVPLGKEDASVSIVVSYVISDQEVADARLRTGSDDGAVWFLNGREVQRFTGGRGVGKDQDLTAGPLPLKKGVNLLTAVVVNGNGETAACARFVDGADQPTRLRAGAAPPK